MIGLMMAGSLVAILNNVAMNVALPAIMADLGIAYQSTVQWLSTINMLVSGVVMPATAFFITRYKSNHVFIFAKLFFLLGTALAIFSPNFTTLLLARLIQSIGVAILMPLLMNVMLASFPREKRGKALGLYGLIYMLAPIAAPLISGTLVDHFGWRMIFIGVFPVSLAITLLSVFKLKNVLDQLPAKLDILSFFLSGVGFSALLLGLSESGTLGWGDGRIIAALGLGSFFLALFVWRQNRLKTPFLNLKVFNYSMFSLSAVGTFIVSMILYAPLIMVPYFFQTVHGFSSLQSGVLTLPGALVVAACMPQAGKLYDRFGVRPLAVIGFPLIAISSYFLSRLELYSPPVSVGIWFALRGVGLGLLIVPLATNGLNQLPGRLNPSGTAINNTIQQVGAAVGIAVFVSLKSVYAGRYLANLAYTGGLALEEMQRRSSLAALNHTFFIMACMALAGFVLSLFMKKEIYQETPEKTSKKPLKSKAAY